MSTTNLAQTRGEHSRSALPDPSQPTPRPDADSPQRDLPNTNEVDFTNDDYTVGWICALELELAASEAMLDDEHPDLPCADNDSNTYTLGRVGQHYVVLACLPAGTTGTNLLLRWPLTYFAAFPRFDSA